MGEEKLGASNFPSVQMKKKKKPKTKVKFLTSRRLKRGKPERGGRGDRISGHIEKKSSSKHPNLPWRTDDSQYVRRREVLNSKVKKSPPLPGGHLLSSFRMRVGRKNGNHGIKKRTS